MENKTKQVLVILNVFDFAQCVTESSKILKTDGVDGVILTNIFFGTEINLQEKYPNLFMLAELVKHRHSEKIVGIEIYKTEDVVMYNKRVKDAKHAKLDMLWVRDGNNVYDCLVQEHCIISNQNFSQLVEVKDVSIIKSSLLEKHKLFLVSGLSLENIDPYIELADVFVINSAAREGDTPYKYSPVKIFDFCARVKGLKSVGSNTRC
jgi:predicted TIM-barrel enzyme